MDEPIQYLDENLVLNRSLRLFINLGLEMRAKIVKAKKEVVHPSTYHGLKYNDNPNQVHISLRNNLDNSIREIFATDISPDDFPYVNLENKPLYDMYEYYTADVEGGLSDKS